MSAKQLCESCFREASQSSQAVNKDIKQYIKEAVQDSIKDLLPASSRRSRSTSQAMPEDNFPEPGLVTSGSDADSQGAQDGLDSFSFDFSLISAFITTVKQAIEWEEVTSVSQDQKYYPNLKKDLPKFPLMEKIKELKEHE